MPGKRVRRYDIWGDRRVDMSNHERMGKGLEALKKGLRPYVVREVKAEYGGLDPQATRLRAQSSARALIAVFAKVDPPNWG
jgi:hypothetical protein